MLVNRILFLLLLSGTVQAQPRPATPAQLEAYWAVITPTDPAGTVSVLNDVTIRQTGVGNRADVAVLATNPNHVALSQAANSNTAILQLTGYANTLTVTQTGGDNTVKLTAEGNLNNLTIRQDGNDVANLLGIQANNARLELIQQSGSNTFVATGLPTLGAETASGAANIRIEQSGGATVHVQTGRAIGY